MGKRALIVEDESDIASLVAEIMAFCEVETSHAISGDEALEKLRSEKFDFAIVDISLPDMNGIDLYQNITARYPELAGRFVFMSGYNPDSELGKFLEETKSKFVHKPFKVNDFREVVKEML